MLDLEQVNKVYRGNVHALQDISLTIEPGLFGLLGPNGAGKSTLMRTLATLQLPDTGAIRFNGLDLIKHPREARRFIGYLPQDMGVYPRVTGREMLEYLAGLKGIAASVRRKTVNEQLDRVNLGDVAGRRLDTYSGGMRQRFGIAAALLGEPKLVIVDEPTAGLDPLERRRFQWMLAEAAQDCVVILSSHIVEDIAGLCSNMALMDQGRIIASGKTEELIAELGGHVSEFETELASLDDCKKKCRVLSWQPYRGKLRVRAWSASPNDLPFENASPSSANLEDFYAFHVQQGS